MLSPVSTSDARQNVQSLLVKTDQQPSTLKPQRAANTEQNQMRSETQNSGAGESCFPRPKSIVLLAEHPLGPADTQLLGPFVVRASIAIESRR